MSLYPYTLVDYTRGIWPFPMITHHWHYSPNYSAKATADGADAFLDGKHIASFNTMKDACDFISEQSDRCLPWFMRPASVDRNPQGEDAQQASSQRDESATRKAGDVQ